MTGRGNNTYLLVGADRKAALIDAGVGKPEHLAMLGQHLADSAATLATVLVTHAHPDHASGVPALAEAHPSARFLKHPWPAADAKYYSRWASVVDKQRVAIGDEALTALHTPGHSPDHVAFWHEASGTIFSGDLVVLGTTVMIHASGGGDLRQYLESLERIRALAPRRLLPAHGPEITDPAAVIGTYISHRLAREEQVLAALASKRDTVESIAESIYDGLAPALMPAAQETVRAHLEKLKQEGRAFEQNARWHT